MFPREAQPITLKKKKKIHFLLGDRMDEVEVFGDYLSAVVLTVLISQIHHAAAHISVFCSRLCDLSSQMSSLFVPELIG